MINTRGCSYKGGQPGDRSPETNHGFSQKRRLSPPFPSPLFRVVALICTMTASARRRQTRATTDPGGERGGGGVGGVREGVIQGGDAGIAPAAASTPAAR